MAASTAKPAMAASVDTDSAEDTYTRWSASSANTGSTKGGGNMNITFTAAASPEPGHSSASSATRAVRSASMIASRRPTTFSVGTQGMSPSTRS